MVKISAIVRADNGGLGTLSRMFADFLPGGFHRTVSLARHEGETFHERFEAAGRGDAGRGRRGDSSRRVSVSPLSPPASRRAADGLTPELVEWLCQGADVLLSFECWYGAEVPAMPRALGCKTALVPMYECLAPWGSGLEDTDLAICPTLLDLEVARHDTPGLVNAVKTFLPIPFDTGIPFRRRETARTFVHNSGHGGLNGRNNTVAVVEAWRHVRSPAVLLLRSQSALPQRPDDSRIRVQLGAPDDYRDLWHEGDVLLHPTRWDALSLPMQEACAAGMPVMTTRFWPHVGKDEGGRRKDEEAAGFVFPPSSFILHPFRTGWLPPSSQAISLPVGRTTLERICRPFEAHHVTPQAIAAAVDAIYDTDISQASADARALADRWSWEKLGPVWARLFEDLVAGRGIPEVYLAADTHG